VIGQPLNPIDRRALRVHDGYLASRWTVHFEKAVQEELLIETPRCQATTNAGQQCALAATDRAGLTLYHWLTGYAICRVHARSEF